jgi:hypothetical protein
MNSTNMENITLKKFVDRAAREAIQRSCAVNVKSKLGRV